jgi:uncharacterized protein GlcG (DUF336 family)
MKMNLKTALRMINASQEKAEQLGVPVSIAVVDAGGNLVAQHRMDNAMLISQFLSLNKAYTSVATTMPTEELARHTQPGGPFFGVHTCQAASGICIFGGGYPVSDEGCIAGGIGVSGGSSEEDRAIAAAGRDAFEVAAGR